MRSLICFEVLVAGNHLGFDVNWTYYVDGQRGRLNQVRRVAHTPDD
jgi:hypothetical protein